MNPERDKALAMFDAKRETVRRVVRFRADRRGWTADYAADVQQAAFLLLWQACRRKSPGDAIDCGLIVRAAESAQTYQRRRDRIRLAGRKVESVEVLRESRDGGRRQGEPGAPPVPSIMVAGERVTLADLRLDYPELIEGLAAGGVDLETVAARLGMHRQTVREHAHELGGVLLDGEWRFPASVGL